MIRLLIACAAVGVMLFAPDGPDPAPERATFNACSHTELGLACGTVDAAPDGSAFPPSAAGLDVQADGSATTGSGRTVFPAGTFAYPCPEDQWDACTAVASAGGPLRVVAAVP